MKVRLVLLLLLLPVLALAQGEPQSDSLLLDATFVPCTDSTESLFIFRDGRAIYAWYNQGIVFTINGALLADLQNAVGRAQSIIQKKLLDSCTTIGVILDGPRYLLINNRRPADGQLDLHDRLNRLRTFARRKLATIDRLSEKAAADPDTTIDSEPSIESEQLRRFIYASPVAQEWRCRGSVAVTAMVGADGRVRQAYVEKARVRGKCASLLTMTALRAVLLSTFQPALRKNGKPAAAWQHVEVTFGRQIGEKR
jgi:hypothetical protein